VTLDIDRPSLAKVCEQHDIARLALFGSAIRDDFGADSDIDVLIDPLGKWTLARLCALQDDLEALFGRHVDLYDRASADDSPRARSILASAVTIYERSSG
jgi:hypothetical protein